MDSDDGPTVWCGNLPQNITEELLYELFLQAAPLKKVRIPNDGKTGKPAQYGFITFKHEVSVDYAVRLLDGTKLHDRFIRVKPRNPSNAQNDHGSQLPVRFGSQNDRDNRFKNYCVEDKPRNFNRFEDKKFRHGENRHNNYNRHDNHNGHGKYNNRGGGHNRYDPIEYNNYGNNRRRRF